MDSDALPNLIPVLYVAIGGIIFILSLSLSAICILRTSYSNQGRGEGSPGSTAGSSLDADAKRYAARLSLAGAIIGAIVMAAGPVLAALIETFGPTMLSPTPVAVVTVMPAREPRVKETPNDGNVPAHALPITPAPSSSPTPTLPKPTQVPQSSGRCTDRAVFISDVTIPDGTSVEGGTPFTKIWRLRNIGTCVWAGTYALVFDHGHAMGGPSTIPLSGAVEPGEMVDVAVDLMAPASSGTYPGFWRLENTNGTPSGKSISGIVLLWVKIVVPDVNNPTPMNPSPAVPATGAPVATPEPSVTSTGMPFPTATPTAASTPASTRPAKATPTGMPTASPPMVEPPMITPTHTFTSTPVPTLTPTPTPAAPVRCDEGLCGGSLTVQAFRDFRCGGGGFQAGVDRAIGGALITLIHNSDSQVVRKMTNADGWAYFESVNLSRGTTVTLSVEWPVVAGGRLVACLNSRETVTLTAEDFLSMGSHFVSFRAKLVR